MSKKIQIKNMLIAIEAIKYNLELLKRCKIKNKYALQNIYDSIFFHIKIINKLIHSIYEEPYGK